jgi:hypothetical protein
MKNITQKLLILLALFAGIHYAAAQGTAFTYNGRLNNTLGPVTGTYDVTFTLFTNSTGTIIQAGPITNSAIAVTNCLAGNWGADKWHRQFHQSDAASTGYAHAVCHLC